MDAIAKQGTWALVPLKSPDRAKSRLAGALSPARREQLFLALAERVIGALAATPGIDHVAVVTASPAIADFSRARRAWPFVQGTDAGMSEAIEAGLRELQAVSPARVLMVPGDLPMISPKAMETFLRGAGREPGIAIVPDRRRVGTNLLLCSPPHAIAPRFGGHSFEHHLAAAAAAGIDARVLQIEELALDIDELQDLEYLQAQHGASFAQLFGTTAAVTGEIGRHSAVAAG
jgi:2-phospho-L-lactate guanylyltransferase